MSGQPFPKPKPYPKSLQLRFGRGKTAVKRDDPRMAEGDGPPMPHAAPEGVAL